MRKKIKFCRHMGGDKVPFLGGEFVQFGDECVSGETLIALSDAGLQQQIKLAPGKGLNQQFLGPLLLRQTFS